MISQHAPRQSPGNSRSTEPVSRDHQGIDPGASPQCTIVSNHHTETGGVVLWAFSLFIFSIPFETLLQAFHDGPAARFTLSRFSGYLLLIAAACRPRVCFRRPPLAFWLFAAYIGVYALLAPAQDVMYQPAIFALGFTLCQMLVLFWISYNLMSSDEIATRALLTLGVSYSLLAVLQLLGVSSVATVYSYGASKRVTVLGEDLNAAGAALSIGIVTLIGLAYNRNKLVISPRWIIWPFVVILGLCIVRTGSRGGMVALASGLVTLLLQKGSLNQRVKGILIACVATGLFAYVCYHSEGAKHRWELTLARGSLSGRERIFPVAWSMFVDSPFLGWGPVHHVFELGRRLNVPYKDTHNIILWILTEGGILEAIPFFGGVWLCTRAAWRARNRGQGVVPFALLLSILAANMSITLHNRKLFWWILAYALASSTHVVSRRFRSRVSVTVGRSQS